MNRLWRCNPSPRRITRSRDGCGPRSDDHREVDALVFRVAIFVLALALPGWIALSLVVVLGRARYDRRHEARVGELRPREAARLIQRARGRPRTDWGRWRRVSALTRLARAHSLAAPRLLRHALSDSDPRIANAAVRSLGDLGDGWAIDILVSALREGSAPDRESRPSSSGSHRSRARGSFLSCATRIRPCASGLPPCSSRTRSSVERV